MTNPIGTLSGAISVRSLFERQVRIRPDSLACASGDTDWSYAVLNRRADKVAHCLLEMGLRLEDRVALSVDRSCDYLAALLGIFKAGGAYVPLDAHYPADYVRRIQEDCKPRVLIIAKRGSVASECDAQTLSLDDIDSAPADVPRLELYPDNLAYVMYTSGSTGAPNGVAVTHRQILNWLQSLWRRIPFAPNEVTAQKTVAAFAVSIKEMLVGLLHGVPQVLIGDDVVQDHHRFIDLLRVRSITRLNIVPSHLQSIVSTAPAQLSSLVTLKHCITAGEPLTQKLRAEIATLLPWVNLWNNYGCTELNDITYCSPREQAGTDVFVPIGRPVGNTRVFVVDSFMRPVPPGVAGELCVESVGIPRGYFGKPALTAERFVANPLSDRAGARLYRTGDIARFLENGTLDYLGRASFATKIRGQRVDIRQIENISRDHPGVASCIVKPWTVDKLGTVLVAYYTDRFPENTENPEPLRTYLAKRLPSFMVPAVCVRLDKFPRLASGKPDLLRLPKPDFCEVERAYVEAGTPEEAQIAAEFAATLGLDRVGIHDDFFELGGHSLLATRLINGIREALGVELPIQALFESPTVAGLYARLQDSVPARLPVRRVTRSERVPLSFAQQRLWFVNRLHGRNSTYNVPVAWQIVACNPELLGEALTDVIGRHEALRTVFPEEDGIPWQEIVPPAAAQLVIERIKIPESQLKAELERTSAHGFDLAREIPVRAFLFELGADRCVLLLLVHHIVWDLWSLQPLVRDLRVAYEARCQGRAPAWSPLAIQYADFTIWQQALLGHESDSQSLMAGQLAYWRERLAGAPTALNLMTDYPRPAVESFRGSSVSIVIDAETTRQLRDLARAHGATLFMVLLSAYQIVLRLWSDGQQDFIIGTPIAGRTQRETEDLIGLFINALALRADLSGDPSFLELLGRVKETALGAYAHQDLPFEKLVEVLQPHRNLGRQPLFQVFFALQNINQESLNLPGASLQPIPSLALTNTAKFDLSLYMFEMGDTLQGYCEYAVDLFHPKTIVNLGAALRGVLKVILRQGVAYSPRLSGPLWLYRVSLIFTGAEGSVWHEATRALSHCARKALALRRFITVPGSHDRSMPAGEHSRAAGDEQSLSATERVLVAIWCEVLGEDRIDINANFFDLGGHSLLATRLASRIRDALGVEVPIKMLFEFTTIGTVAQQLDQARPVRERIRPVHRPPRIPLSFAQRGQWFLNRFDGSTASYNVPITWTIHACNPELLGEALTDVIGRHEALRTVFPEEDGIPWQEIVPPAAAQLVIERIKIPESQLKAELERTSAHGFDLAREIPVRAFLFELGADRCVLLLLVHHIVWDLWSLQPLVRDLRVAYEARCQGRAPAWSPLAIQYADFTIWQQALLGHESDSQSLMAGQLAYWRERLAGVPTALNLMTDYPRPAVESFRGSSVSIVIDAETTRQLRDLARAHGATLFMVLLSAYQIVLRLWSDGQQDFIIGTHIAGRTQRETEDLIGLFINALALRADLSGDPSFLELLGRVKETALGAYAHQDLPFEKLVEVLQPHRNLGRQPLFQVFFALQNINQESLNLPGATLQPIHTAWPTNATRFEVSVHLFEIKDALQGYLEYAVDLYELRTIRALVECFTSVVHTVARSPERPISQLSVTSGSAIAQLVAWNRTTSEHPRNLCIQDLFKRQAQLTPLAVALVYRDQQITYSELDRRSSQFACYLQAKGCGLEVIVAICMDPSPERVVAQLGVFKAGAVYMPLDSHVPTPRLLTMIDNSKPAIILTTRAIADRFIAAKTPVLCLDIAPYPWDRCPCDAVPSSPCEPSNLAYCIYTSGSTGKPKAVAATHAAVVNRVLAQDQIDPWGTREVACQKTAAGFVDAISETLIPLLTGNQLIIPTDGEESDPYTLLELIHRKGVTRLLTVPALADALLQSEHGALLLRNVKSWTLSGEVLPPSLRRKIHDELPWCSVVNLYGSSEIGADATYMQLPRQHTESRVPIGQPICNIQIYVLDGALQRVPIGVGGELYVAGLGLARGYLQQPGLTAQRFVANPFSGTGTRMYRTGDLARWNMDGTLDFLGRVDMQIKIRGMRVELEEIEATLLSYKDVIQASVVYREDEPGKPVLAAYLKSRKAVHVDSRDVLRFLESQLPDYMVPKVVVQLDEFPTTSTGKLDKRSLPLPPLLSTVTHEPETAAERAVAALFASVLQISSVGLDDDFFDLGGHSLLATRLLDRIRSTFRVSLPLRMLFQNPTVSGICRMLAAADHEQETIPSIESRPTGEPPVTSITQNLYWAFITTMTPAIGAQAVALKMHARIAVRLRGPLHVRALVAAMRLLVARHESLRTRLVPDGPRLSIAVGDIESIPISVIDLSSFEEGNRCEEAKRLVRELITTPFAKDVLFRAAVLTLSQGDHVVTMVIHHICLDEASCLLVMGELQSLYDALSKAKAPSLPLPTVQYADFARWERDWLKGPVGIRRQEHWKSVLDGAMPFMPRFDCPGANTFLKNQMALRFCLPDNEVTSLRDFARENEATTFMVVLAALTDVLRHWTGQEDMTLIWVSNVRTSKALENMLGLLLGYIPLRIKTSADQTLPEILRTVKHVCLAARDNYLPNAAGDRKDIDLMTTSINHLVYEQELPGEAGSEWLPGIEITPFNCCDDEEEQWWRPLEFTIYEYRTKIEFRINYNGDLLLRETVRHLVEDYRSVLTGLSARLRREEPQQLFANTRLTH